MLRLRWIPFVLGGLVALLVGVCGHYSAAAQPTGLSGAPSFTEGRAANLFATIDGQQTPLNGLLVQLPAGWTLEEATVLRYGSARVSTTLAAVEDQRDTYLIKAQRPMRSPHEVVLQTRVGAVTGTTSWSVVPYSRVKSGRHVARETYRQTKRVRVTAREQFTSGSNRALSFADGSAGPLVLRSEGLPALRSEASFTAEFWMKTTGLDEAVLSTWTGQEQVAYPMEVVVDVSGRLRFFCGQQGRHQSLVTPRPVADGRWHHVALAYDAGERRLQLLLNGRRVDALRNTQLPAPTQPVSVALGGRLAPDAAFGDAAPVNGFSGWIDEVRLWPRARTAAEVRRTMRRTLGADEATGRVALTFDAPLPETLMARTAAATPRPTGLSFREPVTNLRATVRQEHIRLAWTANPDGLDAFIIERSTDGQRFDTIERAAPTTLVSETTSDGTRYRYTDHQARGQVVYYRVRQAFSDGTDRRSGVLKVGLGGDATNEVQLVGNFPNPFSESTTIAFEVRKRQAVQLSVWDLSGQRITELVNETKAPGYYELPFQASNLPSGTYFVRLQTSDQTASHKMILLK